MNDAHHSHWDNGTDLKWPRLKTDAKGRFQSSELSEGGATITVYSPTEYVRVENFPVEVGGESDVVIRLERAAVIRARAVDRDTGEPISAFNIKIDRCDESDIRARDVAPKRIWTTLMDQGVNVHGTAIEYLLEGQVPGVVYQLIVSAEGYETKTVPRVQATVDAPLLDIELTASKDR